MVKIQLKSSLKVLNSSMGMGGMAIIIYGILMIRVWQPDEERSFSDHLRIPWFFHAFLGVGVSLCAITCLGHVAAKTANICCLTCYIVAILLLLVLETVIMADVFLNPTWEKELPKDLHERLDDFKDFVESNDHIWKWVAGLIFLVQGFCVLLATILRTQEANEVHSHDSEDEDEYEDVEPRIPLLGSSGRRQSFESNIV